MKTFNIAHLTSSHWSLTSHPILGRPVDSFKSWFDIDTSSQSSASNQIVTKLHAILKPFLLRRVKRDVEKGLPPKKEYMLSAALTQEQKTLYDVVVKRQIRDFLLARKDMTVEERQAAIQNGANTPTEDGGLADGDAKEAGDGGEKKVVEEDDEKEVPDKEEPKTKTGKRKYTRRNPEPVEEPKSKRARPSYVEETERQFLKDINSGEARKRAEAIEEAKFGSEAIVEDTGAVRTSELEGHR